MIDWNRLPKPLDDGLCDHLEGMRIPVVELPATDGSQVDLHRLSQTRLVLFFYPLTADAQGNVPLGWDQIAGARGCTPQICAYREQASVFDRYGASLYGVSTQSTAYQREMKNRLHAPFDFLSDSELRLATALRLPTFQVDQATLLKRLTLILEQGVIVKCFYPVFPPDQDINNVINWLQTNDH